ncbi:PP2C family protein-serine/threonine phosphatase [Maricaulis sp.]|uniref:PP2C family protein-serine/threonine phosphatase n=1 Tax=Maricaulis sp. TaxID=1486257 RepID=UPI000C4E2F40|nr:fused response regulator/phosphatase [Maricaulis sp.]MAC89077.1 regulator [Maricaulis sp.]
MADHSPDLSTEDTATILVVDDLKSSRLLIGSILNAAGFNNLIFASDGVEALELLEQTPVDMVILDIVMPRKDGISVCREVRERLGLTMPILIQTSLQDADHRATAFDAGASDIVSKPIHAHEIVSRTRLHLERRRMIDSLQRYRRRMQDELRAAEAMQVSLLKSDDEVAAIAGPRHARMTTFYKASNQLGGDLWQVFEIDETRFGIFMVDLSGHGVAAAINAFRVHMLAEDRTHDRTSPGDWLTSVNANLCQILPVEHFATAFYGVVDIARGRIEYAAAGAPPPILLDREGGWRLIDGSGVILGCSEGARYETHSTPIRQGDRIFFYSDALYEKFDEPDKSLEAVELVAHARAVLGLVSGQGFHEALIARIFDDPDADCRDDLTLILLEVAGDG